jgi:putative iron-regulated protein
MIGQLRNRGLAHRPSVLHFLLALAGWSLLSQVDAGPVAARPVVRQYAVLVEASYTDTFAAARRMDVLIKDFLAKPSAAGLDAAREAWRAARWWYGQTEVYRFYGGPIDGRDGPEARINSWPVDESYIDSVRGRPLDGIINDSAMTIDAAHLKNLNASGGEENIATGWHAIELLLWGQDFDPAGPGARSYEDYVDGKAPNAGRRRQYLRVVSAMLVNDLASLVRAWAPARANYRAQFERAGEEALRRMLVGIGSLARGELAGERLEVALATQDQEDEQSCFSDNTHNDIIANTLALNNVWLGQYRNAAGTLLEGASLRELVAEPDPAAAEETTRELAAALDAARAIHAPFDQEILGDDAAPGRQRIRAVVDALKQASQGLAHSARAIGITRLNLSQPKVH